MLGRYFLQFSFFCDNTNDIWCRWPFLWWHGGYWYICLLVVAYWYDSNARSLPKARWRVVFELSLNVRCQIDCSHVGIVDMVLWYKSRAALRRTEMGNKLYLWLKCNATFERPTQVCDFDAFMAAIPANSFVANSFLRLPKRCVQDVKRIGYWTDLHTVPKHYVYLYWYLCKTWKPPRYQLTVLFRIKDCG